MILLAPSKLARLLFQRDGHRRAFNLNEPCCLSCVAGADDQCLHFNSFEFICDDQVNHRLCPRARCQPRCPLHVSFGFQKCLKEVYVHVEAGAYHFSFITVLNAHQCCSSSASMSHETREHINEKEFDLVRGHHQKL